MDTQAISVGKNVIRNVQLLRGVSALLVVFVHLDKLLSSIDIPQFGGGGVDIFFVISGFIMVYTTIDREISPRAFIADRVARVVPLYWSITLAVFVIALVAPSLLQATQANWTELTKSLLFIPFLKSNGLTEPILFVGWSLNYEMFFYMLFAVCLACPAKRFGYFALILCLLVLVGCSILLDVRNPVAVFYTSPVIMDFAIGIVLGVSYGHLPAHPSLKTKFTTLFVAILCLSLIIILPLKLQNVSGLLVCGLPAGVLVSSALLLERGGWTIKSSVPLQIGAASYSIYLTHPFVTQISQKVSMRVQANSTGTILMLIATLTSACIVGVLVHKLVERPLSRATRRLSRTRRLNPRVDELV